MRLEYEDVAFVQPSNIPGLVNVFLTDGRQYRDLTVGQVRSLFVGPWEAT